MPSSSETSRALPVQGLRKFAGRPVPWQVAWMSQPAVFGRRPAFYNCVCGSRPIERTDMAPESYLERLTTRISDALSRVDPALRQRQTAYLLGCQNPDGGWSGREGDSDLYYTAFALRGLAVLDALALDVCDRSSGFLRGCLLREA